MTTLVSALFFLVFAPTAYSQLAPEIGYVLPAGTQAGTTREVVIGGYDWTPDMQLFAHDPRMQIELVGPPSPVLITEPPYWFGAKARGYAWPLPREFRAKVTVPADMALGFVRWQVANANGVSPVGVIPVGRYPEVLEETLSNGPQILPALPVAISGQIRRIEETDRYQFRATANGPISIELIARQLTTPTNLMALHGMLQVHDDTGRRMVDASASEGLDLTVHFAAEANRNYIVSLHDLDFAGDRSYVYQLLITPGPGRVAAIPAAGKRGETRPITFVGYGIATGGGKWETLSQPIPFPSDPAASSFTYELETPFGKSQPYIFSLSDAPEFVSGAAITELPCAVTGTLTKHFGSDEYAVPMKKGDVWQIQARSRTIELPLDLDLSVMDSAGKQLATADDSPTSIDPELVFTAPTDGNYRVIVSDHSGHSGHPGAVYRLSFERPPEDFRCTLPDWLSVPSGATANLLIQVTRLNGFRGPISLTVNGLPEGLSVPPDLIVPADKNDLAVVVTSSATAPIKAGLVQLTATTTLNGAAVTRPLKSLVVASIMKPRIKITPEGLDDVKKIHRGSTHPFPLLIERLEGFAGEITIEMTAKQQRHRQGLTSDEMVIPAAAQRVDYPIFVPEWMETTKTSRMMLNGSVRLPDPQGNVRTLLQRMELRLGLLPEGALMKLAHAPGEHQATLGQEFSLPLTLSRVSDFRETARIEFVPTEAQSGELSMTPCTLPAEESQCTATLYPSSAPRLIGDQSLTFRATALQDGKWLVKSETTVIVTMHGSP